MISHKVLWAIQLSLHYLSITKFSSKKN